MRKRQESGFALLLVFLMAAVIAISLYMEIPRVAFQSQRQKEQLLIERGEQYKRAIQLFVKTNGRYPAELKDLENFNNRRFLRHKFIDPMTGKDDWRLVHINNGVLTDSVLNKKKDSDKDKPEATTAGQYISEIAATNPTDLPGQANLNNALSRRRASDGGPASPPALGPDGLPIQPPVVPSVPVQDAPPVPVQGAPPVPPGGQPPVPDPNQTAQGQPSPQQLSAGQLFPGTQPQADPGGQPAPATIATPQPNPAAPVPPDLANQPGGQPNQPFPGRVPAPGQTFGTPGSAGQSTVGSQSYVGGGQSYVGSSQPYVGGGSSYVGGGSYVGSQSTTPSGFTPAPSFPGQPNPQPASPGPSNSSGAPGYQPAPGFPGTPGTQGTSPSASAGSPQPGAGGQNPAADMINNILRNPRPAPAAVQPTSTQTAGTGGVGTGGVGTAGQPSTPGQQIGGGIAGVASKSESPAIMVYNDHSQYNEWEFVFDYTKQQAVQNPNTGAIGTPAGALGSTATPAAPGALGNASLSPVANPNAAAGTSSAATAGSAGGSSTNQAAGGAGQLSNLPRLGRP